MRISTFVGKKFIIFWYFLDFGSDPEQDLDLDPLQESRPIKDPYQADKDPHHCL